jgi:hypothetical protein
MYPSLLSLLFLACLTSCSTLSKAVDTADKWGEVAKGYQAEFSAYRVELEAWRAEFKRLVDAFHPTPTATAGPAGPGGGDNTTDYLAGGGVVGVLLSGLLIYLRNKKSDERKGEIEDQVARLEGQVGAIIATSPRGPTTPTAV